MGKSSNTARQHKKPANPDSTIVKNKKVRHDFFVQDTFEAGMVLQGWEVKSMRQKKNELYHSLQ